MTKRIDLAYKEFITVAKNFINILSLFTGIFIIQTKSSLSLSILFYDGIGFKPYICIVIDKTTDTTVKIYIIVMTITV
jgi:hypothetical protein